MTVAEFDRDCWLAACVVGHTLKYEALPGTVFALQCLEENDHIRFHTAYSDPVKKLLLIEFLGYTDEGWKRALCGCHYGQDLTFGFVE